jgi:outer membrane protein assembly factor BamB
MRGRIIVSIVVLSVFSSWAYADWPDWRGPTADGRSDVTGLPLTWSETENVVWKTPIHGLGHSTPVVLGDQIWFTTADEDGKNMYAVCVDFNTGKIIHNTKVLEPEKPQRINDLNSYATPSAVVEEGRVYVHYGTHGTACLDSKTGKVLWRRTDLNCKHMQGPASSPVLFGDLLIVHLEGTDVQFIAALDKKTGEPVWRTDRPEELYADVSRVVRKAYHTPVILEIDGKAQLVSNGAQAVMGYEPLTGKEIWRVVYGDDNTISRIVADQDMMFVNCGGMDFRLWAVRKGGTGDVTDSHVVWKVEEDVPFRASPVLVDGLLYMVNDQGILTCLEAKTGEVAWSQDLDEKHSASPLYADGRIYILDEKGRTRVIKPGRTCQVLAINELDGSFFASPVVAGKSLLLRTKTNLYRIESK